jgi:hypothetical protein
MTNAGAATHATPPLRARLCLRALVPRLHELDSGLAKRPEEQASFWLDQALASQRRVSAQGADD